MRRSRRAVAAAAGCALVLAACTSGEADTAPDPTRATTNAAGATTARRPAPDAAADQARADAAVLRLADFPAGWEADDDGSGGDEGVDLEECKLLEEADDDDVPSAESPTFSREAAIAGSTVLVVATETEARLAMDLMQGEDTRRCFEAALQEGIRQGLEEDPEARDLLGDLALEAGTSPEGVFGDETATFPYVIRFRVGDVEVRYQIEIVSLRVGRAIALLFLGDIAPSAELRASLLNAVVSRLATP